MGENNFLFLSKKPVYVTHCTHYAEENKLYLPSSGFPIVSHLPSPCSKQCAPVGMAECYNEAGIRLGSNANKVNLPHVFSLFAFRILITNKKHKTYHNVLDDDLLYYIVNNSITFRHE